MILNRRSILAVFAFILIFANMPAALAVGCYDKGKADGIAEAKKQCKDKPESCGITPQDPNAITEAGINAGKKQCQDNPESCGLIAKDPRGTYDDGFAAGKASCPPPTICPTCKTCPPPTICPTCQNCTNLAQQARASGLAQGNVEGKNICKNDLSTCFEAQPFKPSGNKLADEFCDYKTKNCFSTKQAVYFNAIYLGTEDAQGNPITNIPVPILLKDLQMEVILKDNKLLFLNEEWNKYFVAKEQQSKLTITVTGTGNVISYPSGINCGTDCKEIYKKDSPVELFAVSTSSTNFEEWAGDCTGNENKHSIIMDKDQTCTAVFNTN